MEVLTNNNNKTRDYNPDDIKLLQVSSPSCGPCIAMKREIDKEYGDRDIGYQWVDMTGEVDKEIHGLIMQMQVRSVPTFIVVDTKEKKIHGKWVGGGSMSAVRDYVNKYKS